MTLTLIFQFLLTGAGGAIIVAIVNALVNKNKVKSEANNTDVKSAESLFEMQRKHNNDLGTRLDNMQTRLDNMENENSELTNNVRMLKSFVWDQQQWINRVYSTLTPDQKNLVGEPPHMLQNTFNTVTANTTTVKQITQEETSNG